MEHELKKTPASNQEGDYLFGIKNLASFLQVCEATARRLHKESKFPKYSRGRKLMFRKSEVIEGLRQK
jgi:hypothetical protein